MGSKSKTKVAADSPVAQVLNANLTNSTFGFVSKAGWKGKSPASSSRSILLEPDLDLLGGFAFLSFTSLDELQSHIEINETTSTAISVNVCQKRKAEPSVGSRGGKADLNAPPSKKKAATGKKKAAKKSCPLTTDALISPREKTDTALTASTFLADRELFQSIPAIVSGNASESNDLSSSVFSEISLLCSETVDLGDDEDPHEDINKASAKSVATKDVQDDLADLSASVRVNEVASEGVGTSSDLIPRKKKKKKRKYEHCDQTSQTKFRIKKRGQRKSKVQDSGGTQKENTDNLREDESLTLQDVENLQIEGSINEESMKTQGLSLLLKPKMEKSWSARTIAWPIKGGFWKNKLNSSESASDMQSLNLTVNLTSEPGLPKEGPGAEKISLDSLTMISSDQEVDIGDETTSISVFSDLSDHSSEVDTIDGSGCFLLNNRIEKVEKEESEKGDEFTEVDIETVGKETSKNFLVVSGVEASHFSYHPGVTRDGTIDTSIQALPNEIDIFLQCAKMQEGEVIKIIKPDDSEDLHSHLSQKNGRDPDTVKATRSATERKRRHHLGDLFNDMKVEVFTDLVDVDLYFSKQAILSKGISTVEELTKESKDLINTKNELMKANKDLQEKRNLLMFGKTSINVEPSMVDAILKRLNITIEEEDISKLKENLSSKQDIAMETSNQSKGAMKPCVKGRPRAKKTLLSPVSWISNISNRAPLKNREDPQSLIVPPKKTTTEGPLETSKDTLGLVASSTQTSPSVNLNASCEMQSQKVGQDQSKLFTQIPHIFLSDSSTGKSEPSLESTSQEESNISLVKILPKPSIPILQLHPTQQKVIKDTLGQVKQPSSDKIICNLSRLSTQQNPSNASGIRIIRSDGPLMKSLESKNVMHITITGTSNASKNADGASLNTTLTSTSTTSQQISAMPSVKLPNFVTRGTAKIPEVPGIQTPAVQKHVESAIFISKLPLKPVKPENADGAILNTSLASTLTTSQQSSAMPSSRAPNFATIGAAKTSQAPRISTTPIEQKHVENTILVSEIPLKPLPTAQVIIDGKQYGVITSTSNSGVNQSINQQTSDIALRALASLNKLQANKVSHAKTATSPASLTFTPVAGILSGLKNVVMKVVPRQPDACSTTTDSPILSMATSTPTFQSSQVNLSSSKQTFSTTTKHPQISLIPIIPISCSSPLNTSLPSLAQNSLPSSPSMKTSSGSNVPLIKTCLDPFNLVPKQIAASSLLASNPPTSSSTFTTPLVSVPVMSTPIVVSTTTSVETSLATTALDLGTTEINNQVDDLVRSAQSSPKIPDDIFKEESSHSSTVLTQEMLQIPGIEQNPDLPLAKLPEVIENLVDLDKNTDDETSPEPSCESEESHPKESTVSGVTRLPRALEIQVEKTSISAWSSSVNVKKATSPLRVEIKDFRKVSSSVKKESSQPE
ncbi:mucin-17-like [Stylophora pistillata]|uniref:Uncharacterized protein n=1 Tax=Stylophora pistillata TaxID=50429 RepID=A0A2B4SWE6_STYPI|nr:mucin-17-like [Stylophora pistillata]PFX33413.1 hypothetical protein AWC38_SpisGene1681 [Stylophora pistillata]